VDVAGGSAGQAPHRHRTRMALLCSNVSSHRLFMLQLADAPWLRMDELQWSRHFRCFPGQGAFDLKSFLGRVLAARYGAGNAQVRMAALESA
jgi:sugar phosphate isomerase/epimerase